MKKIFTLLPALCIVCISYSQNCTTAGFDICEPAAGVSTSFKNAVQITGTGSPLTVGAKYKFNYAVPALNLDAVITINAIVNATMKGAENPAFDDDGAANESGISGSQVSLFAPRIAPDQILGCTNRTGYIEFTLKFYTHYTGNAAPAEGMEIAVANLNFLNFDIDGQTTGTDGVLRETIAVKTNGPEPENYINTATELIADGANAGWWLIYGSSVNRVGLVRCAELIEKSVYPNRISSISFRLGYDYKAPSSNCTNISIQPTRDYGVRAGCFNLPAAGPLPVSLVNLGVTCAAEKANITWTSLQENNLDSYEIQRSFDGINFEVAGTVKANNLTTVQLYKFTDDIKNFNSRYIYYRIRIADLDHSMKLTNTVLLKVNEFKSNEMFVAPNPSGSNPQLKVKAIKAGPGYITIVDAAGKVVLKQQAALLAGNNTVILNNITSLSDGYYTIHVIVNNETFNSRILIWK